MIINGQASRILMAHQGVSVAGEPGRCVGEGKKMMGEEKEGALLKEAEEGPGPSPSFPQRGVHIPRATNLKSERTWAY